MKANAVTREVVAVMEVEEGVCLELSIKLPLSWPLVMAEVECRRQVLYIPINLQPNSEHRKSINTSSTSSIP